MIVKLAGMKRLSALSGLETSQVLNTRPTGGYQLSIPGLLPVSSIILDWWRRISDKTLFYRKTH